MNKIICISGGFDPLHVGHVRLMEDASRHGSVFVILNSDEWLMRKKGYMFMTFDERKEIITSMRMVHDVIDVNDDDGTVCEALERIRPSYFGNGGDRLSDNVPEVDLCKKLNIEMVWNLGGEKIQSSSDLVRSYKELSENPENSS
jgi:D-beta-D-heptose 7-phosphate kinase/D-beta-D-heptose 1-phosphate adenosyltransferase